MTDHEKFELWASSPEHELTLTRFGMVAQPGQYVNADTQAAWEAWQARQPEIDELKAELDDETAIREMVAPRLGTAERADKAEAEVVRLREAIRDAPHTQSCRMWKDCARDDCGLHPGSIVHDMGHPKSHLHHTFEPGQCTCWKRAALKEE